MASRTRARRRRSAQIGDSAGGRGSGVPSLTPGRAVPNRGMVPRGRSPFGAAGGVPGGPVRSGGSGRRSCAQAHHEVGQRRVRRGPDRTGSAGRRAVASTAGQGTPTAGSSQAKPSSSVPSYALVTRYRSWSGSRARNPWATPAGMTTQSSSASSRVSTVGAGRRPSSSGPDVDERDERPPGRRRSSSRAGAGGEWRPRRTPGADVDRLAWTKVGASVGARVAGRCAEGVARHSSRNEPRSSACRAMAPYRTPGSADGGRSRLIAVTRGPAPRRARGPARSRPSRRATPAAARPTAAASAPGRPSAAGRDGRSQVDPGRARPSTSRPARPTTYARPVGPRGEQAVDEVVDAGVRVLGEQLHDRIGDVGRVGRRAPFVADGPQRLAGRRAPARPPRGSGSGSRGRAARTATPSGRCRAGARRPPSQRGRRPRPLARELRRAVRVARRRSDRSGS